MRDTNSLINKKVKKTTQVTGSKGTRQATKFAPQSPRQAKKEKEIMASEKRRAAKNKLNRVSKAIMTLGGSEVARKIVKSDVAKKVVKSLKNTPPFKMKGFGGFGKTNISKKDPVKTPSGFNKTPNFPKPPNPNVKFFKTNPFGKANATFTKTKRK